MKNRFYFGFFEWQGREYRGKHELFVPEDLFWQVQETFGIKSPYIRSSDGIFGGGWMKCAMTACGCHVVYDPKKKQIKETGEMKVYKFYHCTNGKKLHPTMRGMALKEEQIWEQFVPAVDAINITEDFAHEIAEALNEGHRKAQLAIKREMAGYDEALRGLEGQEDRVYEDYTKGMLDKDGYLRQIQKIRDSRRQFTQLMGQANLMINDASFESARSILELATNAKSLWKTKSPSERKAYLDRILSNPVLDAPIVRYALQKPFAVLVKMRGNEGWRREWDSNPRYLLE